MRIAVLANNYPALSEQFVRREVEALQRRGHDVAVFVNFDVELAARDAPPTVPVQRWIDGALRAYAPEVLYAEMGLLAHIRALEVARLINTPVLFRVWQGYDTFARPSPDFYRAASRDRLCLGVVVEDEWNRDHAIRAMGVDAEKIHIVPNSIDTDVFRPVGAAHSGPTRILAVSRFVPKKGLIHLVRAFNRLHETLRGAVELTLIGYGPEEPHLRAAAQRGVTIAGTVPAASLPDLYREHDIYAAPGIVASDGDADGIPTTVLEAMSCGLPVVVSDLLSARQYVPQHERGLLVSPGDETALYGALHFLVTEPASRAAMGAKGRAFAARHLDLKYNIEHIEALLLTGSRGVRWRRGVDAMSVARVTRPPELAALYERLTEEALAFWSIAGDVLDVGCGTAHMGARLNGKCTSYFGVDPDADESDTRLVRGTAEALPALTETFDTVLCNSVLQHVESPDLALSEMYRVLKRGGMLAAEINVADPNPIFLWWWSACDALALVERAGFRIVGQMLKQDRYLYINAVKP